jgi:hypothetical protein
VLYPSQMMIINRLLNTLRQPRPCRACGMVFTPVRTDQLACSSTCASRRARHGDFGYFDQLDPAYHDDHRRQAMMVDQMLEMLRRRRRERRAERAKQQADQESHRMMQETVATAFHNVLRDARVHTLETTVLAINQLTRIPVETIRQILKELMK